MKNKNKYKKIKIIGLTVFVMLIVVGCGKTTSNTNKEKILNETITSTNEIKSAIEDSKSSEKTETVILEENTNSKERTSGLSVLYQSNIEHEKVDIVVGDNYFDTQIADWNLNIDNYVGKVVEIEGFALKNSGYTFVGRYSTSNLCVDCPTGYTYFEYEWSDKTKFDPTTLEDEQQWIKIIGTIQKGSDAGGEYHYIEANSIELISNWGKDTVSN